MSFLDDAIGVIGQGLAQTAATAIDQETGMNVGGALNVLFGGQQSPGGSVLQNAISTIGASLPSDYPDANLVINAVSQQTVLLNTISNQIGAIAESVQKIAGQIANIEALLNQLQQEMLYNNWSNADPQAAVTWLNSTYYHQYQKYIGEPGSHNYEQADTFSTNIQNNAWININSINSAIMGEGQKQSVLELWSEMVTPLVSNGYIDYRDAVAQYFNYYRKLVFAQLQGINMVMEVDNYQNPGSSDAAADWATYRALILAQEQPFLANLFPLIYSSSYSSGAEPTTIPYTGMHAILELDPLVQALNDNNQFAQSTAYYQPSLILRSAEELLAKLYVTGTDERRIVVQMLFEGTEPVGSSLQAATLTLTPSRGAPLQPASPQVLGPYSYPGTGGQGNTLDVNFLNTASFYVSRFVFSTETTQGLPDDSYSLTNLDNQYPPVWLYGSPVTPMMLPSLNAYVVSVDAAQQFDFMNFMAYAAPRPGFVVA